MVYACGIGPVRLERDGVETFVLDQRLRDARAQAIKLRAAVRGLADQHHACVAYALEQRAEVGVFGPVYGRGRPADMFGGSRLRCRSRRIGRIAALL